MNEPLDEQYFKWLYSQVADPEATHPSETYWKLFQQLYTKEFVWTVDHDDNRVEDGKMLRQDFLQEKDIDPEEVDPDWLGLGCSMMELILGLSKRLAFQAEGEPHYWFWHLLENLGLDRYNDRSRFSKRRVDEILDRVILRQYEPNGDGGLFPLTRPDKDQRQVELWYQLCEYVLERVD